MMLYVEALRDDSPEVQDKKKKNTKKKKEKRVRKRSKTRRCTAV